MLQLPMHTPDIFGYLFVLVFFLQSFIHSPFSIHQQNAVFVSIFFSTHFSGSRRSLYFRFIYLVFIKLMLMLEKLTRDKKGIFFNGTVENRKYATTHTPYTIL